MTRNWWQTEDGLIHWAIHLPKRLKLSSKRAIQGNITFQIRNKADSALRLRVIARSLTPSVYFESLKRKIIRSTSIKQIQPKREISSECVIERNQEGNLKFKTFYRPHLVQTQEPGLRLQYEISAFRENGAYLTGSGSRVLLVK